MESLHPLRIYRESKGINATELAESLGVKRNTVWRWENRRRRINPNLWDRISEKTGIPIKTLATAQLDVKEGGEGDVE